MLPRRRGWIGNWDWHIYTTVYKVDNWWEQIVYHRELYSMLCGDHMRRKSKEEGICICVADSVCCITETNIAFSSVHFSHSAVSDSLRPHEPQHARPPSPSSTPRVHPKSCPSSWWCHPAISSSVVPFSSCPQSFPSSESFQWVSSLRQVAKVLELQILLTLIIFYG